MTNWKILQTEKAYNSQIQNTFVLSNSDKNLKMNKIELTKILTKQGLSVIAINTTASYQKIKSRGAKKRITTQFRPKKWYVKLKAGQTITEDVVNAIK
jgi:ribosomal protein L23